MDLLSFPHSAYLVTTAPVSLFDGTATATLSLGTWPAGSTGRLKITVSSVSGHTDCTGTITAGTETITFTQASTKTTSVTLTAKPVTTSANLDCHVHITVIDAAGADIVAETSTAIKIRFEPTSKAFQDSNGEWTQSSAYCMVVNSTIALDDTIRYNSTDYSVRQIEAFPWLDGNELYRILYF